MFWQRHKRVAVALTCADWRLHHRRVDLNARLARALKVGGVDLIAVPGPDGLLRPDRQAEWAAALGQIVLLIGAHSPSALIVLAHQRCAGHPVSDPEHDTDVASTAKALKTQSAFAGPVLAYVAAYQSDSRWQLKRIGEYR